MKKCMVVGLGVFGRELAMDLTQRGAEVIAIDDNMELVEAIQDKIAYAVRLDATDEYALASLGLEDIDLAVVCIGEDFQSNLLAAVNLIELGVKRVIARASNPTQRRILRAVKVDMIIEPEIEAAKRLAFKLVHRGLMDINFIAKDIATARLAVPPSFVGKSLKEIALRARYGINLIAIYSAEKVGTTAVNSNPSADTVFQEGDVLLVIGNEEDLQKLSKLE